jgi:hypothetical protein
MSTSGTDSYNETQSQIIYASARKLGFISFEETLSANAYTAFSNQLNLNIKALDATGLHLWTEEEAILFLQPGQYSYTLGGTTTDNCAWTNYNQTALTNNAATGATSIVVNSAELNAGSKTIHGINNFRDSVLLLIPLYVLILYSPSIVPQHKVHASMF